MSSFNNNNNNINNNNNDNNDDDDDDDNNKKKKRNILYSALFNLNFSMGLYIENIIKTSSEHI